MSSMDRPIRRTRRDRQLKSARRICRNWVIDSGQCRGEEGFARWPGVAGPFRFTDPIANTKGRHAMTRTGRLFLLSSIGVAMLGAQAAPGRRPPALSGVEGYTEWRDYGGSPDSM